MEVYVKLVRKDLAAFQTVVSNSTSKSNLGLFMVLGFSFVVGIALAATERVYGFRSDSALLVGGGFAAGTFFGIGLLYRRWHTEEVESQFKDILALFEDNPWKYTVASSGVTIERSTKTATVREICTWQHFSEIVQTGNHIFLLSQTTQGHIIPRTSFAFDQEFLNFGRLCRDYFDATEKPSPLDLPAGVSLSHRSAKNAGSTEITNVPPNS